MIKQKCFNPEIFQCDNRNNFHRFGYVTQQSSGRFAKPQNYELSTKLERVRITVEHDDAVQGRQVLFVNMSVVDVKRAKPFGDRGNRLENSFIL